MLNASARRKKKVVDPTEMGYPVEWPNDVPFVRSPSRWTRNQAIRIVAWLKLCGDAKDTEFVSCDIASSASKIVAEWDKHPARRGTKRPRALALEDALPGAPSEDETSSSGTDGDT